VGIIPSPSKIWVGSHQDYIPPKFLPAAWIPPGFQRFRPAYVGHSKVLGRLTIKAVSDAAAESSDLKEYSGEKSRSAKSITDAPAARIDDSSSPSIGLAAARLLEVEPEKERWRNIARDWYAAGIAEQPGTGKLHRHLGLLSREVGGEELRGVYHFVKRYLNINFFHLQSPLILLSV
jgi:protein SMG6